jgi:hypothetical protein
MTSAWQGFGCLEGQRQAKLWKASDHFVCPLIFILNVDESFLHLMIFYFTFTLSWPWACMT